MSSTIKNNANLHKAKKVANDEFYTHLCDIENEMKYYANHFEGKKILCPCDEREHTNFTEHFMSKVEDYKWDSLFAVGYSEEDNAAMFKAVHNNANEIVGENIKLLGNGDFRNAETCSLLNECDIVVTNPPFSLFREFIAWLVASGKKFAVIGPQNAITYKEIFALIKENKIWLGNTHPKNFMDKNNKMLDKTFGNICWFTNMEIAKRKEVFDTGMDYERGMKKGLYQKYDNYNAINVDKTSHIPMDFNGVIGVPISFLEKHNPDQFEIVKFRKGDDGKDLRIGSKQPYFRILIRKKV